MRTFFCAYTIISLAGVYPGHSGLTSSSSLPSTLLNKGLLAPGASTRIGHIRKTCRASIAPAPLTKFPPAAQVQRQDLFVENDGKDELRGAVHLWRLTRYLPTREPDGEDAFRVPN